MRPLLDERTAWELIGALPGADPQGGEARRVYHDPSERVWLQVQPSGRWELSGTPDEAARSLLDVFVPLRMRPDYVIAQIGQSLDGRIATPSGHSHYVTGREDIRRLHRLRAIVDAVVVGAGTVIADDPRLTVREVTGPNPVRVVLDPRGRAPSTARVFSDGAARTIRIRAGIEGGPRGGQGSGQDGSPAEIELPAGENGMIEPATIVAALRGMGLRRLLVEGGAATVSRFLDARALDRLHVTVAPMIMGSGPMALDLRPIERLDEAMRPRHRKFALGEDTLYDIEFDRGDPGNRGDRRGGP